MKKAIVIGAGLGGLSAAITMQSKGVDVTVFDENPHAGGKMMSVDGEGFHFDFGPNTMTMPYVFQQVIKQAGENPDDYFTFQKLTRHTRNVFPDGSELWQTADEKSMIRELDRFGPHTYDRYTEEVRRLYTLAERHFFHRTFRSWKDYLSPSLGGAMARVRPFESMDHFHRRFFSDERVLQVFNRYATYIGSSPFKAPATFSLIGHLEMNDGVYYVKGGNVKIARAFQSVFEKKGGSLQLNTRVKRLIVRNQKAVGVELQSGEKIEADFVVINGDFVTATRNLIDEEDRPTYQNRRLDRFHPSISAFVMMIGKKERMTDLPHHQVMFTSDYEAEFRQIFQENRMPEDPTIYISHSAATDPAVTSGSNLFILVNAPAAEVNPEQYKEQIYERLIQKGVNIGAPDFEKVIAPQNIARQFSAYKGALYGISSHNLKDSFLRPRNGHPDLSNVYYAGGTTHPGGGSPMVVLSGLNVPFSGE